MASVSSCRGEEQPPALPVKQRKHSSMDCDSFTPSPFDHKLHNFAYNEVFTEPTDCHATQCPIHQSYDPSRHQMRFFSDGNPPPVPKKRLVRTHSFPGIIPLSPSPRSPLSPLQKHPQNFDNPLYMMAPIPDAYFHEETEDINPPRESPAPLLSFSQLSFDTPDEHLPFLFSNFVDQQVVSQGIQHRHLLFLRSMAQSMEDRCMLQGVATERDVSSYHPQDFLLCESSKPKQIGDKIYYSLYSPNFPKRELGLRVHKQTNEASSRTKHQPLHANLQHILAYFQPTDFLENSATTLQAPTAPSCPSTSDCSPYTPAGSSTENAPDAPNISPPTVQSFLQSGHCVSIERDLPHATLQDFVQQSRWLQSNECLDYDRQVCVLLLQILMGSHHLYNNSAAAVELRPQDVFLVWPSWERENGENTLKRDASEGWSSRQKGKIEWEKMEEKEQIQVLWKTHGSPRVVLTPKSSTLSGLQLLASIKIQIEALIQLFLQPQESPTCLGTVPLLSKSPYRRGLLHLSSMIKSESRLQMTDMVAMLQVILWGPRVPFLDHRGSSITAVHSWLTIKRALLVMKLAEKGLIQDQSALDWEDSMCLQYLSFTDSETIQNVVTQLWRTEH
ncbi:inactive tyrosine-protein kinase PEAK1 [Melanotaenia boesemani]|uniref:inactive tyrosine-protein kinase PEAK1 n=1 Tax=Melanotaenia boesemani TaxID=1250792 RepID=UPI001C03D6D2|nr:inactive tyrosine-protein kinase PEAK1 [Melanotaenia boesemani]